ncbi:hypothetical protein TraAM80_07792 [Trypanosoma rangeli]|uniref:Uncharacterized protein n=1 Tax=Trypanosoma rangeli TaxID=5698 RepID=A0A3S5IQG8_TRYRA|nr:uncharacterized protein TraAM80_07792 [Trypanosoma rangeli]RNF00109.1 hypothetical protein TraAM80_07792 [Trypanosoma rangeli]|eukprot:RNF00109.1 hypothetical protein TraAM80_07792 [Trypanosoma rangeli]
MSTSKVLLADGTEGLLNRGESYCSLASINGAVWALRSCGEYVDVLDSHGSDVLDSVHLPERCGAIRTAANKLWLLTRSGHIILCDMSGVLIGVLNAGLGRIDNLHTFESCPLFFVTSQKGAFQTWDLEQMAVRRVFPCEGADILAVFPVNSEALLLTVQEDRMALWGEKTSCPVCVHTVESATTAVLVSAQRETAHANSCWVGGKQWITVFHILETINGRAAFKKERLIPCARVQQLVSMSLTRIVSFDAEFLVTVWDSCSCTPLRLFKVNSAMGIGRDTVVAGLFLTGVVRVANLWMLCGNLRLSWADQGIDDGEIQAGASVMATAAVLRGENTHLRKKNVCLLEMMDAYRQKVVEIVSNPTSERASVAATVLALDKCLAEQVSVLRSEDDKPHSMSRLRSLRDQVEYWQEKYKVEKERNRLLLCDLRLAVGHLKESGFDSRVDVQLANLLALNTASQARESELRSRLLQLEVELHKLDIVDSSDVYPSQDSQDDGNRQRARVQELEKELQSALEASEEAARAQQEFLNLAEVVEGLERSLHTERCKVATLTGHVSMLERKDEKMLHTLTYLQEELNKTQREKDGCNELLNRVQVEADENERRAFLALAETREELQLLRRELQKLEGSRYLASTVSIRDTEIVGLKKQLKCVRGMLLTRHEESRTVTTACDSMVGIIQSMQQESQLTRLVNTVEDIDTRLERLSSSTKMWMEREDQIAARDDEILVLKNCVQSLESRMRHVSSLFQHIPYSVEGVESLLLELNEYRRRYGRSEEIEELVALRLLELEAPRNGDSAAEES